MARNKLIGKVFLLTESQMKRLNELKKLGLNPQHIAREGIELMLLRYEPRFHSERRKA